MGTSSNKNIAINKERPPWDMEDEVKVVDLNEHRQVMEARRKITDIVHNQEFRKFLSEQTLNQYEEYVAAQKGTVPKEQAANSTSTPHADSLEGLLMMFDHLSKEWEAAKLRLMDIKNLLKTALTDKIANEADLDFLVEHLILTGEYNLTQENATRFKQILGAKIENMRKDRKAYEELSGHRFVTNDPIKKLEASKRIKLGNLDSFLKVPLPDRRAFLKELKDALLKEEALEAYRERNRGKMVGLYKQRLDGYYFDAGNRKGCIGEATYNAYAAECEDLDLETLKIWHQELKNQMAPRVEFWKKVRTTLSGPGLVKMESQMHKMGLGALKQFYPEVRKAESERLCADYDKALLRYTADGTIGEHSALAFQTWIRNMPLTTQYQAKDRLEEWEAMGKYKALRAKIATLPEDQQVIFEANMDEWGYKECTKELGRLGIASPEEPNSEAALKGIRNHSVREAAIELKEDLESKGQTAQQKIINLLQRQGRAVQIVEFEKKVQAEAEEAANQDPNLELDQLGRLDTNAHLDILEKDDGTNVTDWSTFQEIEGEDGQDTRHVVLSEAEGMNKLLSEYRDSDEEARATTISLQDANQQEIKLSKQHAANIAAYLKEELKAA